ncbi:MAG: hypothetical protein HYS06_01700 [Methylocystis sp.]|nr:hypothetical protein [Methylocystis sp.]
MAGLDPAIHVFGLTKEKGVDARDKRGHDESLFLAVGIRAFPAEVDAGLA